MGVVHDPLPLGRAVALLSSLANPSLSSEDGRRLTMVELAATGGRKQNKRPWERAG